MLHCPVSPPENGCLQNTTWHASPGWTTRLALYRRRATVHYARSNGSILALSSLSAPAPLTTIAAPDLLAVYNATFAGDPLGFGTNTAGAQTIRYLAGRLAFADFAPSTHLAAGATLRNLLALPLYYFSPLYLAPPAAGPPPALAVRVALGAPVFRVAVAPWTVALYAGVGGAVLAACAAVLARASLGPRAARVPPVSGWPAVDLVALARDRPPGEPDGLVPALRRLRGRGARAVAREVDGMRLYVDGAGPGAGRPVAGAAAP